MIFLFDVTLPEDDASEGRLLLDFGNVLGFMNDDGRGGGGGLGRTARLQWGGGPEGGGGCTMVVVDMPYRR